MFAIATAAAVGNLVAAATWVGLVALLHHLTTSNQEERHGR